MMSSRVNNSNGTDDNEAAAAAAVTTAAAELVESIHMLLDKNGSAIIKLKLENKTLKKKLISHQQYISENENLKLEIKKLKAALAYAVATKATNEADDDSNRDGVAVLTLLGLPIHLRVTILNFLGQTQDELRTLTIISKQFYKECNQPGIKWKIIPTIIIRPKQHQIDNSIRGRLLLQSLRRQETKLRRYSHMIIYDLHKFSIPGGTIGFRNYITLDWILYHVLFYYSTQSIVKKKKKTV